MSVVIILKREKCIGCNYCVEQAPEFWRMSKKDGKTVLLHSEEKRGFHVLKTPNSQAYLVNKRAEEACPVKIIQVKQVTESNISLKKNE
jgi:ferredoxin